MQINHQHGYTLPVFACAAAIAAVHTLQRRRSPTAVELDLLQPAAQVTIPIDQGALLNESTALAITRSDPGNNLDITRHTPVWAHAKQSPGTGQLIIHGGEGIGRLRNADGKAAIYDYAQRLLLHHLEPLLQPALDLTITLILPEGRDLAKRTSNAAFGVVQGLSLLGTSGIAHPLSAPDQLNDFQAHLQSIALQTQHVIFCVGENGLDLAKQWGANEKYLIKTANWLGSMLVTAATAGIQSVLLLGYHGKLIKLAGGIFHTHHFLADARNEILTAYAVQIGLPATKLRALRQSTTTESALQLLRSWELASEESWVTPLYQSLTTAIDKRSERYVYKLSECRIKIGSLLFDGDRHPIMVSRQGQQMVKDQGLTLPL